MAHDHSHHHHHQNEPITNVNTAFVVAISLNFLFVLIEAVVGISINSVSLLSDAGHNLGDVGSLALSLLAFKLLKVKTNKRYTYGYRKTSILVALLNAMILMLGIGAIAFEAVRHLFNPEPLPGKTISIVAAIGIVINAVTAIMFLKNKEKDMNIKSAYLHLMSDALVSAGLVVGGIIISYTHWFWLDPALSIVIAIVILIATWSLLIDSLRLSLDAVPEDIDIEEIKKEALKINGVKGIHHIHDWAISTTENAMTGHIVVESAADKQAIKLINDQLKHELLHLNIHHATIETEFADDECKKINC